MAYGGTGSELPVSGRMALVWNKIQDVYARSGSPTSSKLTNLQVSMFVDSQKPHQGHPFLKVKASEMKYLIPALVYFCKKMNDDSEIGKARLDAATSIEQFCLLLDVSPVVPNDSQAAKAIDTMNKFLFEYGKLKSLSESDGNLYHSVPKMHMSHHMAERFKYLNPRFCWTFKCEDFVGKMSKLAHNCTYGIARLSVSASICEKTQHLMHLRLTRGDFSD